MTAPSHDCCVTFPVQYGVFGVDRLAQRLNALVRDRRIGEWHPGRWTDWRHTAIAIAFATPMDAAFAKSSCRDTARR